MVYKYYSENCDGFCLGLYLLSHVKLPGGFKVTFLQRWYITQSIKGLLPLRNGENLHDVTNKNSMIICSIQSLDIDILNRNFSIHPFILWDINKSLKKTLTTCPEVLILGARICIFPRDIHLISPIFYGSSLITGDVVRTFYISGKLKWIKIQKVF